MNTMCWVSALALLATVTTVSAGDAKNLTITVAISFHGKQPQLFKKSSCLVLRADQGGIMDGPAKQFGKLVVREPKLETGSVMKEKLEFPLPDFNEAPRQISISATINNGWCSDGNEKEWIRKGDYLTDTNFDIELKKSDSLEQYTKIFLVPYS